MTKSCKPSKNNIPKKIGKECTYDFYLSIAKAWDTQDLTVPWDWKKAHMEEIEQRTKQKTPKKQS